MFYMLYMIKKTFNRIHVGVSETGIIAVIHKLVFFSQNSIKVFNKHIKGYIQQNVWKVKWNNWCCPSELLNYSCYQRFQTFNKTLKMVNDFTVIEHRRWQCHWIQSNCITKTLCRLIADKYRIDAANFVLTLLLSYCKYFFIRTD